MRMIVMCAAAAVLVVGSAPGAFANNQDEAPPIVAGNLEQLPVLLGQTAQGLTAKVALEARSAADVADNETNQCGFATQQLKQQSQLLIRKTENQASELQKNAGDQLQQTKQEALSVQQKAAAEIKSVQKQTEGMEKKTDSVIRQVQNIVRRMITTAFNIVCSVIVQLEKALHWMSCQLKQAKSRVG